MSKFIINLFLLTLIVLLLLSVISEFLILGIKKRNYDTFEVLTKIESGSINAEILFSGSSRSVVNFDPRVISSNLKMTSYNIGFDGTGITTQIPVLKTYLEKNTLPLCLVQIADFTTDQGKINFFDPTYFIPYVGNPEIFKALVDYNSSLYFLKYSKLLGFLIYPQNIMKSIEGVFGINSLADGTKRFDGYKPLRADLKLLNEIEETDNVSQERKIIVDRSKYHDNSNPLFHLIEICKDSGIKLVLVYPPIYHSYLENRPYLLDAIQENMKIADSLNIKFIDLTRHSINYDIAYFYDAYHLNAKGSSKLSEYFSTQLSNILESDSIN